MAQILKESIEIVFDPLMNILMGIFLKSICILMGRKVTADREWGKKSEERS